MGTRGIMGVRIDGADKLTYNHWDSYPDGLGVAMYIAVHDIATRGKVDVVKPHGKKNGTTVKDVDVSVTIHDFTKLARDVILVNEDTPPTPEQIEKLKQYADLDVSTKKIEEWYVLLRKTQGLFLLTLQSGFMIDSKNFIDDSLFCEYAYIVNLDEMVFETYKGFQKSKHDKGRYGIAAQKYAGEYWPCALIDSTPISKEMDSPDKWLKRVKKIDEKEDE